MQENVRVSSAVDETVSRSITPEQPVGEALSEPGEETSKQASGAEVINETGVEIASEVGGGEPSQTEQDKMARPCLDAVVVAPRRLFSSNTIIKFADDTVVVGLISNNDEKAYLEEVADLSL
ncbi:hypothetical protein SKAU_G00275260 [Synaphobranchus kaupii]|uniref:Uncharacterized protein n=1 Tax=Synaphobranchus kaupii TaxID=118154 RepID=A0A9Q1F142_SYNKA|nr:hypothetical protein SKAU_G00275260 [Synaphobranchus kaupii]